MAPLQQHDSFAAALTLLGRAPVRLGPHLMLSRRFAGGLRVNLLSRVDLGDVVLPDLLKEHRAPVIVSPEWAAPGLARNGAVPVMTPATLAELPLTDAATMRAAMHPKWRNRLKQAETLPLRLSVQKMKPDPGH